MVHKAERDSDDWITNGCVVKQRMSTTSAETLAIAQALQNALCMSDDSLDAGTTLLIYSDCKSTLKLMTDFNKIREKDPHSLLETTRSIAGDLTRKGFKLDFRCVPSHQHVPGNVLADKIAMLASKR